MAVKNVHLERAMLVGTIRHGAEKEIEKAVGPITQYYDDGKTITMPLREFVEGAEDIYAGFLRDGLYDHFILHVKGDDVAAVMPIGVESYATDKVFEVGRKSVARNLRQLFELAITAQDGVLLTLNKTPFGVLLPYVSADIK